MGRLNLLSAAVALLAVGLVLGLVAPRAAKGPSLVATDAAGRRSTTSASGRTDAGMDAPDASEESVFPASSSVYFSGAMVSHMYTAFNTGYQFMGFIVLFTLLAKQIWAGAPSRSGGRSWPSRRQHDRVVRVFSLCERLRCTRRHLRRRRDRPHLGLFALPAVHTTAGRIIAVTFLLIVGVVILGSRIRCGSRPSPTLARRQ